jgi:hypothetical protein
MLKDYVEETSSAIKQSIINQPMPKAKYGRGLVVALNISKPVIADYCVVCCCLKLTKHLMQSRINKDTHSPYM